MYTPNHLTSQEALEEARKILESSAQTNRNLFITFNFLLAAVLVLCLNVTDEMLLLLSSSSLKLPLINVELPVWAFASIAPLALVALHFDLLQNLGEHRNKLVAWCDCWFKVYPAPSRNADMPKQLFPFLFDFAWLHVNHTGATTTRAILLPGLCWLLYCWAGYTVLVVVFIRFADLQHFGYTSWHLLLLLFDALILHWYWPGFTQIPNQPSAWLSFIANIKTIGFVWVYLASPIWVKYYFSHLNQQPIQLLIVILVILVTGTFKSYLDSKYPYWITQMASLMLLSLSNVFAFSTLVLFALVLAHINYGTSPKCIQKVIQNPTTFTHLLYTVNVPHLRLAGFRLKLPNDFFTLAKLQHPDKNENQLWQKTHDALNLSRRSLAFADFRGALLPHSDLSGAILQGANLVSAQLQGANLSDVKMQDADLSDANLQGANFMGAQLQGANFYVAHLQGADFWSAHLQGAILKRAELQGADLSDAKLQGANFLSAQLQGADFEGANLQGADFMRANMQGVVLLNAQLKGVALSDNQLASTWVDHLDWKTGYAFTRLKAESWAQPKEVQQRLVQAQQRLKAFKSPQLPPPIGKEAFTKVWLGLLCNDAEATKGMLWRFKFYLNMKKHHINNNKAQVQHYLDSHEHCAPYRTLFEQH